MERDQVVAGRYRLRQRLGAAGPAERWQARDQVLGRDVAVKVLALGASADLALRDRIWLEARAAARLRHRNVAEVYDFGEATTAGPPVPFVVTELVDGRPLAELLTQGALHWPTAVRIGAPVAAALAAAHARGTLHRALTARTVLVGPGGVKVVDFGVAATMGATGPAVLAPERLGGGLVTPDADVYALGLLLYQSLAGHLPWDAATVAEMLSTRRYRLPAPLPTVPGLPPAVADLCHQCLADRPGDRPLTEVVAEALDAVAAPGTSKAGAGAPPRNRHPYAAGPHRQGSRARP
jgi:serine/threonine-protein kinase